jgi:hypothetical protein
MTTQTAERQEVIRLIEGLSDDGVHKLVDYVKSLAGDAEIAALEAKYGTTPNAETLAAIKELEDGGGEVVTIEQIMAELNADN